MKTSMPTTFCRWNATPSASRSPVAVVFGLGFDGDCIQCVHLANVMTSNYLRKASNTM
jgi:hypothetical protein